MIGRKPTRPAAVVPQQRCSGLRLGEVAFKDAADEKEFGKRLREFDRKLPRDRWLLVGEWDHDRTFQGLLPTAELLDKYVPDRPVFLRRCDGHIAVANAACAVQFVEGVAGGIGGERG